MRIPEGSCSLMSTWEVFSEVNLLLKNKSWWIPVTYKSLSKALLNSKNQRPRAFR